MSTAIKHLTGALCIVLACIFLSVERSRIGSQVHSELRKYAEEHDYQGPLAYHLTEISQSTNSTSRSYRINAAFDPNAINILIVDVSGIPMDEDLPVDRHILERNVFAFGNDLILVDSSLVKDLFHTTLALYVGLGKTVKQHVTQLPPGAELPSSLVLNNDEIVSSFAKSSIANTYFVKEGKISHFVGGDQLGGVARDQFATLTELIYADSGDGDSPLPWLLSTTLSFVIEHEVSHLNDGLLDRVIATFESLFSTSGYHEGELRADIEAFRIITSFSDGKFSEFEARYPLFRAPFVRRLSIAAILEYYLDVETAASLDGLRGFSIFDWGYDLMHEPCKGEHLDADDSFALDRIAFARRKRLPLLDEAEYLQTQKNAENSMFSSGHMHGFLRSSEFYSALNDIDQGVPVGLLSIDRARYIRAIVEDKPSEAFRGAVPINPIPATNLDRYLSLLSAFEIEESVICPDELCFVGREAGSHFEIEASSRGISRVRLVTPSLRPLVKDMLAGGYGIGQFLAITGHIWDPIQLDKMGDPENRFDVFDDLTSMLVRFRKQDSECQGPTSVVYVDREHGVIVRISSLKRDGFIEVVVSGFPQVADLSFSRDLHISDWLP